MTTQTAVPAEPLVVQPDEGTVIDELHVRVVAPAAATRASISAAVCTNPGPGGPPLHTHHAHDEYYYVLKGTYRFKIGERVVEGGPGLFVSAPRNTSHTFASVGPDEGQMFFFVVPGGIEKFLERMAGLPVKDRGREGLEQLFLDFDSEIDGPPLL